MSRVADLLRNGDQDGARERWKHLIQSLCRPTRRVSESDVSNLIWRAIWESRIAADVTEAPSPEALENEIKELEEKLETVGDDRILEDIQLRNMLQKQQQILQTLSNVSKMLHDTAQAVIRNMG